MALEAGICGGQNVGTFCYRKAEKERDRPPLFIHCWHQEQDLSHAAQQLWRLGCQHCFPGPSCWVRKSLIVQTTTVDGIQESLMLSSISNLGAQLLFLQQAWQIVQDPEDHIINTASQKRRVTHLLRVHFPSLKKIHCLALFAVQWNSKSFFTISPQQQEK